ncbi:MurR/RpiR family transcriptional regulator [Latilactobacillus curvatus]|uniref:MurR/RpiR family transcriptional regulator n=1 Tax=Latilactobacillus curvatus TaxID=28038 RepID=A0AAC9UPR3_LATCU|nr:MurR/RpiR family transcriptional regulator [Latilactobacillus curvatus]ASN59289.1 hypothetical protein CG419_00965 [Latilactobacillus curvatus]MCW8779966.1 MurR/RpiR family transcriptional regulator [Latilactobacillus curvatus]
MKMRESLVILRGRGDWMSLEERVKVHYQAINEIDNLVLAYIFENQSDIEKKNIHELAQACHVSNSYIFRLAKKLGYSGFADFKYSVSNENKQKAEMVNTDKAAVKNSLCKLVDNYDKDKYRDIYKAIHEADNIFIFSTGWEQQIVASQLQRNLFLCGKNTVTLPAIQELDIAKNRMTPNDLLFVISLSGQSSKVLDLVNVIKLHGVRTLSMTKFAQNPLANVCLYNIFYEVLEKNIGGYNELFFSYLLVLNDLFTMGYADYINEK